MTSEATPNARAEASRRNGANSRGPVTAAGRATSARNALKHGLRARAAVLLDGHGPRVIRTRVGRAALMHRPPRPTGRTIGTLLRYRGSVVAELFRALGALKALQAEARAREEAPGAATLLPPARTTERTRDPQEPWGSAAGNPA